MDDPRTYFGDDSHVSEVESLSHGHLSVAREAWLRGDFDTARMAYQKTAYISGRLSSPEIKDALKRELSGFARNDPLYQAMLVEIRPLVDRQPGVKQTDLYAQLDRDREAIGYVLYFAAELGDLLRKKAGRSYQIFPPGRVIDSDSA